MKMKKIIFYFLFALSGCQAAVAQGTNPLHSKIPDNNVSAAQISANFFKKYPEVKYSNPAIKQCGNCTIEVNPYFSTITDQTLGESVVSYANYTPTKEAGVIATNVDRTKYGSWHAYPGDPNEDRYYVDINKGIKDMVMKYAKGHYVAFLLCSWTLEGAIVSCTYKVNEALENQGQNAGTEFDVENLTRAYVGSTSKEAQKTKYKGPVFAKVDFWKGSWSDPSHLRMVTADGISRVYSNVYWNVLKYGGQTHVYWFPNDISAQHGYDKFEIPFATLVQRLGFDPTVIIKAN